MRKPLRTSFLVFVIALMAWAAAQASDPMFSAFAATDFTVNTTSDSPDANLGDGQCATSTGLCSLRAAIQEANHLPGLTSVTLPSGSYVLTVQGSNDDTAATGDLDITDDLVLEGTGAATTILNGNGAALADRVLDVITGTVMITGITIEDGQTDGHGGGVRNSGTLAVSESIIQSNRAISNTDLSGRLGGGGLFNSGTLTLTASTIASNTVQSLQSNSSEANGGGLYSNGTAVLINSTIAQNTTLGTASTYRAGGGIYSLGVLTLTSSTIIGNVATTGGGVWTGSYKWYLHNSLIADNLGAAGNLGPDCSGYYPTSLGYNLIGNTTGCSFVAGPGDLLNLAPQLNVLGAYGSGTLTVGLLNTSPAVDAGQPDAGEQTFACLATDQRGILRPADGNGDGLAQCDIGAFELAGGPEATTTATPTATASASPTQTATSTPSPTATDTGTATSTNGPPLTPSTTPSSTPTVMATQAPFRLFVPLTLRVQGNGPTATPPSATPTGDPVELIVNGGLESGPPGAPWVQTSNAGQMISSVGVRTGQWAIYMGGVENAVDRIYQTITVPANAIDFRISYWRLIRTTDSRYTPYDYMRCVIMDTDFNVIRNCGSDNNTNASAGWGGRSSYVQAPYLAGQTIRIGFAADNDSSLDTQFFVDDISVTVHTSTGALSWSSVEVQQPSYVAGWEWIAKVLDPGMGPWPRRERLLLAD